MIFYITTSTMLLHPHSTLHSSIHLKQAMKFHVKKEPITNRTQI